MTNEETIFATALNIGSAGERSAYLDQACAGDAEARRAVEALLLAHEQSAGILEAPPPGLNVTRATRPSEEAGAIVGPYKLLQQIGEGGMAVVFLAEQSRPIQRKVALKIIKPGMDSRQVIARFEAERQALAVMDHTNIAKVLEAGTTDSGRPYFVMELVKGVPITRYCDEHRLSPRERLELFVQVCSAVQHAHTKGIIHRDLKPSNVLVALYDGKPVPKVIDFGIAKATGQALTERTLFTTFGSVVGTPEYMSPEQAELNQLDVDTRSDIYSLGVLLYELLTGSTPVQHQRFKSAALLEMLRVVREEEPQRPSTRLSTSDGLPGIAANRGLEPKKLSALVHGELDWIVMKSLEKDRNRRYETANGFAMDVQRYLDDETVQACPPSAVYRFRKFARRNRAALTTAGLVAGCLLAGVVLLAVNNMRLKAEQERTAVQEKRAQGELRRADGNLTVALEALDAIYINEIEGRGYRDRQLSGVDRERLQRGLNFYEQFARQNSEQANAGVYKESAKAQRRLGYLWRELQQLKEAESAFTKAIPVLDRLVAQSPDVLEYRRELASCLYGLSVVLRDGGQLPEAEERSLRALGLWEALVAEASATGDRVRLGHTLWHQGTLDSGAGQYESAERRFARALKLFEKLSADVPDEPFHRQELAFSHRLLAQYVFQPTARIDEAVRHARAAVAIYAALAGEASANMFYTGEWEHTLQFLARLLTEAQQPQEAAEARRQVGVLQVKLIEPYRIAVATKPRDPWAHQLLGDTLVRYGALAEGEAAFREAIRLEPNEAGRHQNLADALRHQGRFKDAAEEYTEAARLSSNPYASYHGLGSVCAYTGQWARAAAAFERAAELSPTDSWSAFRWVILCFYTNDQDGYRRACRTMLDRFGKTNSINVANDIVKACSLTLDFASDGTQVMKLADFSLTGTKQGPARTWYEITKGLVDYRASRFGAAAETIVRSAPSHEGTHRDALAFSILAMAQHRLRKVEEARTALASAQSILSTKMPRLEEGQTFDDDWHNWLHAEILHRQAEQVLKGS